MVIVKFALSGIGAIRSSYIWNSWDSKSLTRSQACKLIPIILLLYSQVPTMKKSKLALPLVPVLHWLWMIGRRSSVSVKSQECKETHTCRWWKKCGAPLNLVHFLKDLKKLLILIEFLFRWLKHYYTCVIIFINVFFIQLQHVHYNLWSQGNHPPLVF